MKKHFLSFAGCVLVTLVVLLLTGAPTSQAAPAVTNCATQTEIPRAECETLVALYNSTGGPGWWYKDGWNQDQHPCTWWGVQCGAGSLRHVTEINLEYNFLEGSLPDLAALTQLTTLNLYSWYDCCQASADSQARESPASFRFNSVGGAIPNLSALRNLEYLNLDGNQFSGAIPDISTLADLEYLFLANNHLSGNIPLDLPSSLIEISLSGNQLGGSIPDLAAVTNLEFLYLSNNQIRGYIPIDLPSSLVEIDLSGNQLSGTIPNLSALTSLTWLLLSNNGLTGGIPASLPDSLGHIDLSENHLSGSIPSKLPSGLWELLLTNNDLTGSIPATLPANLWYLDLSSNQLTGSIPLSLPAGLGSLNLASNQLSGSIVNRLPHGLAYLYLDKNQFGGVIPTEVCNYAVFEPGYNKFAGEEDPCVTARAPGWAATQTVPPTGVEVHPLSTTSLQLNWLAIPYTADGGYYEVLCGPTPGGPYASQGTTAATGGKSATSFTVSGLAPGASPYCVVRTFTPRHGDQQNDLTSDFSTEVHYVGGDNRLTLSGWRFSATAPYASGTMADGVLSINVTSGAARACWYQDLAGASLAGQTVRFEAEMRTSRYMNPYDPPPFTNPYISLQVRQGDGSWVYNVGGIVHSRSAPGGPWLGESRDILLPNDMTTLRAAFCVWNAGRGTAQARYALLRTVVAPPPPAANLLSSNWSWAPATAGLTGSRSGAALQIDVTASTAQGCWIQDLPGAFLQGKTLRFQGAMRKTGVLDAGGFVNPYLSLQVRQSDGKWLYNYGGLLNSRAISGGPFVAESRSITIPAGTLTLRAAFCVWKASPGGAALKDFVLQPVTTAADDASPAENWDEPGPDTPSLLPDDAVAQPEDAYPLWLPSLRG